MMPFRSLLHDPKKPFRPGSRGRFMAPGCGVSPGLARVVLSHLLVLSLGLALFVAALGSGARMAPFPALAQAGQAAGGGGMLLARDVPAFLAALNVHAPDFHAPDAGGLSSAITGGDQGSLYHCRTTTGETHPVPLSDTHDCFACILLKAAGLAEPLVLPLIHGASGPLAIGSGESFPPALTLNRGAPPRAPPSFPMPERLA